MVFLNKMSERDERVVVRNGIMNRVLRCIEMLNKSGNKKPLSRLLVYIDNVYRDGFSIELKPTTPYTVLNYTYTADDKYIVIKDNGKNLIAILKLKTGWCEGEYRAYAFNHLDFWYDADIIAEAQALLASDEAFRYEENESQLVH